jgi:murein DD-endopeptidase MepM/ murein hydrolase activator NlpD
MLVASLVVCLGGAVTYADLSVAHAQTVRQIQRQIKSSKRTISTLAGQIDAAASRLQLLDSSVSDLKGQISEIQTDLYRERSELLALRTKSTAASGRLSALEAYAAHTDRVLAAQLTNSYESGRPDLVGVVLAANGFQQLLEQLNFDGRIQKQDAQVVNQARAARRAVASQATRLGRLELRQQTITTKVLHQRNALSQARVHLMSEEQTLAQLQHERAGQLAWAKSHVVDLRHQLADARAAAAAASVQTTTSATTSDTSSSSTASSSGSSSSAGFVFPLPRSSASPPSTWSPDEGVDIAAPGDTPEYAVCSGTIVLHGIGGFGPWAPVLHCDGSIDGFSYVYYGHAGPNNQLPVGTHVDAGQVMSSIGPGIVGISTGPHLEIGFADSSGSPIGSQTAGTMLSLLQAAYNS